MSVDVMSRVWRDSPQKANRLLVLLAIADIADDLGWAYPAQNTLAKKCRVGRRAVQKLLDDLEERGEIVIYNRFDPKSPEQHFSNVYHLQQYGLADAVIPSELRGVIRKRGKGSEQSDATPIETNGAGVVNTETLGGSEHRDTTVVNTETLPSEQPDTRVVNSGSHYSLQEPSVTPSQEPPKEKELEPSSLIPEEMPTDPDERAHYYDLAVEQVAEHMNGNGSKPYTDAEIKAQTELVLAKYGKKNT